MCSSDLVEVDNLGRRVHTIEKTDAMSGNDVYLTIDLDLQKATYESVERRLSEALVERLKATKDGVNPLKSKEIIISMLESSQLDLNVMKNADEESIQKQLYERLMNSFNALDPMIQETMTALDLLIQSLEENTGEFTEKEVLIAFNEQNKISLSLDTVNAFKNNKLKTSRRVG